MKKTKSFQKKQYQPTGDELMGLLVASYGASADVEDESGRLIRCHLHKNMEPVITGDKVLWHPETKDTGVVVGYLPRKSLLSRPEGKSKTKPVAANLDILVIVTAPNALFEHLIDRYLVAAENSQIEPVILFNKMDLLTESEHTEIEKRLAVYKTLGYQTIFSSTLTENGLVDLNEILKEKSCALVGASGVGKSSITAVLTQNQLVRIGETSAKGQGKHTTTLARLYHLANQGSLIDFPGVREFGLWHMSPEEITKGFVELKPFLNKCRYRDCTHVKEIDCALQMAVQENKIDAKRFASYLELLTSSLL